MTDEEVKALPEPDHPRPFAPFPYNEPATNPGQGLKRLSRNGVRWCPFCQTVLARAQRSCDVCRPIRRNQIDNRPPAAATQTQISPGADPAVESELRALIEGIDELARAVAMASAYQNTRELTEAQVEGMFFASKEVMVLSDPIRRRLNGD